MSEEAYILNDDGCWKTIISHLQIFTEWDYKLLALIWFALHPELHPLPVPIKNVGERHRITLSL